MPMFPGFYHTQNTASRSDRSEDNNTITRSASTSRVDTDQFNEVLTGFQTDLNQGTSTFTQTNHSYLEQSIAQISNSSISQISNSSGPSISQRNNSYSEQSIAQTSNSYSRQSTAQISDSYVQSSTITQSTPSYQETEDIGYQQAEYLQEEYEYENISDPIIEESTHGYSLTNQVVTNSMMMHAVLEFLHMLFITPPLVTHNSLFFQTSEMDEAIEIYHYHAHRYTRAGKLSKLYYKSLKSTKFIKRET